MKIGDRVTVLYVTNSKFGTSHYVGRVGPVVEIKERGTKMAYPRSF